MADEVVLVKGFGSASLHEMVQSLAAVIDELLGAFAEAVGGDRCSRILLILLSFHEFELVFQVGHFDLVFLKLAVKVVYLYS